jgi:hypothetical protein
MGVGYRKLSWPILGPSPERLHGRIEDDHGNPQNSRVFFSMPSFVPLISRILSRVLIILGCFTRMNNMCDVMLGSDVFRWLF